MCFFQFSSENIVFMEDCREKPVLHNFQLSLQVSKLNEEYITNIIKKKRGRPRKEIIQQVSNN